LKKSILFEGEHNGFGEEPMDGYGWEEREEPLGVVYSANTSKLKRSGFIRG